MSFESDQKISALEQKTHASPKEFHNHLSLARLYLQTGRPDAAEAAAKAAVHIDPGNQTAYFILVESLVHQNK